MGIWSERLKDAGKKFAIETAMVQMQPKITKGIREYLEGFTSEDLIEMVKSNQPFPLQPDLVQSARNYLDVIKSYKTLSLCQLVLEQLSEARPDIFATLVGMGVMGSKWLFNNVQLAYDVIVNPEIVQQKLASQKVSVNCSHCGNELVVDADKKINIKSCPFCGTPTQEVKNDGGNTSGTTNKPPTDGGQSGVRPVSENQSGDNSSTQPADN